MIDPTLMIVAGSALQAIPLVRRLVDQLLRHWRDDRVQGART